MDWFELASWNEYTKLLIGLFVISAPIAAIPIFISLSGGFPYKEKLNLAAAAAITYGVTLVAFVLFGEMVLGIFGISIASFKVAGGILLLINALEMIKSKPPSDAPSQNTPEQSDAFSLGIIPLAIPLLAGPGSISIVVIHSQTIASIEHKILVCCVVISVAFATYFIFRSVLVAGSMIGKTTLSVMCKVMGILFASLGVEFVLGGVAWHYQELMVGINSGAVG